jgi:hypothetical protein
MLHEEVRIVPYKADMRNIKWLWQLKLSSARQWLMQLRQEMISDKHKIAMLAILFICHRSQIRRLSFSS